MTAPVPSPAPAAEPTHSAWEEWKYHHDFFWQAFFRICTAALVVTIIPFAQTDVFEPFPFLVFLFPALVGVLGCLGLMHLRSTARQIENLLTGYRHLRERWDEQALSRTITLLQAIPWAVFVGCFATSIASGLLLAMVFRERSILIRDFPMLNANLGIIFGVLALGVILTAILAARKRSVQKRLRNSAPRHP